MRLKIEERFERERERESRKRLDHIYNDIISLKNLFISWEEFLCGKRKRQDVAEFSLHLMDNIFSLHYDLLYHTYNHGGYQHFKINDPKPRDIHKASVRDRLLHHAIYRKLYPFFDKIFITDSYSCRLNKGTHKAINMFREFSNKVSKNNTNICWVLQCDIKKFFANINHDILLSILREHILDQDIIKLLENIIRSFSSGKKDTGLPLGNLTSQLLVNIYMNKFDQFVKHKLKVKYYIRYADDFVILDDNRKYLKNLIPKISEFLKTKLELSLNQNKLFIKTFSSGVDFLGWLHFPNHRTLRTATKRRMLRNLKYKISSNTMTSYLGLLSHGDTHKLSEKIINMNN